jgi:hypothetical protein
MLCGLINADVIQQVAPKIDVGVRGEHVSSEEARCFLYNKDSSKTFVTVDSRKLHDDGLAQRKRVDEFVADADAEVVSLPSLDDLGYGRVAVAAPSSPDSGTPTEVFLAVVTDTQLIRIIYRPVDGATGDPAEDAVTIAKDLDANLARVQSDQESDSSAPLESPADPGLDVSAAATPSWLSSRLG